MTQRNTAQALEWYRTHTTTKQIGFNPDGMCLKICRTARNIGSKYPSAKAAQDATPLKHRISDISKIEPGMVMYFDDPWDSNKYGHIVTVESRKSDVSRSSLSSLVVWTNSVEKGKLVRVSADYFPRVWGDPFVFASDWLNGVVLDLPAAPPVTPPPGAAGALQGAIKAGQAYRDALKAYRATLPAAARPAVTVLVKKVKETIQLMKGQTK